MKNQKTGHWVFRAHVVDRSGALTSIASAFSNEGVSIDTVVGHGVDERAGVDGSVVLTFCCSQDDKDLMVRKVKRLTKVIALEEHAYHAAYLRKSIMIRTNRELKPLDVAGESQFLTSELVKSGPLGWTYLLAGAPSELDPVLANLEGSGVVQDIVYAVLSL